MITKENLSLKIHACGLRSSHIVKYSCSLIKPTQASQWINFMHNGVGLGKAAMVMMWNMCELLEVEKSSRKSDLISRENGIPQEAFLPFDNLEIVDMVKSKESETNFNSFLVRDKINVMLGTFIRKANGVYFNVDGDIYLHEGVDNICVFEKDGKESKVRIGSGTFGKFVLIS